MPQLVPNPQGPGFTVSWLCPQCDAPIWTTCATEQEAEEVVANVLQDPERRCWICQVLDRAADLPYHYGPYPSEALAEAMGATLRTMGATVEVVPDVSACWGWWYVCTTWTSAPPS